MSAIDFGRQSEDYAAYRPGFPASFYKRFDSIAKIRGSRTLDLATGPGTIALELAERGSSVVGIDISEELVATADRLSGERDLGDKVLFRVARAENTGLAEGSFDLVTAGQSWHWFDSPAVMQEIQRVLRPGGLLAIAYYSYLADSSPVAHDTEELILEFNPVWTMAGSSGMFPELIHDLDRGGFDLENEFCYDHEEKFSHARWRGRMKTCNGVGSGGLSQTDVLRFDEALGRLLVDKYPEPLMIRHRVWCLVVRKPS